MTRRHDACQASRPTLDPPAPDRHRYAVKNPADPVIQPATPTRAIAHLVWRNLIPTLPVLMTMTKALPLLALPLLLAITACGPTIFVDLGDDDDDDDGAMTLSGVALTESESESVPPDMGGEPEQFGPGSMWGPCPTLADGTVTLCNSTDVACVPSVDFTHNICLPIGDCPDPPFGVGVEVGWGDACYPRCETTSDCADGQICTLALADGGSMCAWPVG